ncbi:uncharacterized protein LOC127291135 [Leptopilina boulardi]|uniref:uncharacterized protein LOC127291135 n=1 Tax=Leptopilina boulardi TaxID=63433 RepID=UPI0021F5C063|nr:uncharacterized protein LOC127291135 [Leptopilina boulardi]
MDDKKLTVVTELHRQARRNYPRRKVEMRGIDETWQADLVEMIPYSKFNLRGNYKWEEILQSLVKKYNNNKHRTIGMKPKDVSREDEKRLLKRISQQRKILSKKAKFKVGDKVRTTEIFTITQVKSTKPVTYKLKDYQDQPIEGGFYVEEISKVKYSDVYLVEKFLKNRHNKVYVKWLGFDNSHNSWINKLEI